MKSLRGLFAGETGISGIMGDTMRKPRRIVIDTNVLVAGLRSRNGASFELLSRLTASQFELFLTVPLAMEYADVLTRPGMVPLPAHAIESFLDMICKLAIQQEVHFLWRPQLRDAKDELVLEAAVNAGAHFLVTHNLADFGPAHRFDVRPVTPGQFLDLLDGERS